MKTEYRYLAQDKDGNVYSFYCNPRKERGVWIDGENGDFFFAGKHNENWQETLIDLTKDDFKIEDGILTKTTDPHKAMKREWEESGMTKIVQFRTKRGKYVDTLYNNPTWGSDEVYRFKPEVMYCRMYELIDWCGEKYVTNYFSKVPVESHELSTAVKFIRWIGPVQEVEIDD